MQNLSLKVAGRAEISWAQEQVRLHHYLHAPVDARCRLFVYIVQLQGEPVGCLIFGRPEATRCYTGKLTYGSCSDIAAGRAKFERWEVLNLARVWLAPRIQHGGELYIHHAASLAIRSALRTIGCDYLLQHPPVDCSQPYQIRCVLSYCDTRKHNGYLYLASRFKLARTNKNGIQTYMKTISALNDEQDQRIRKLCEQSVRSKRLRMLRVASGVQLNFGTEGEKAWN